MELLKETPIEKYFINDHKVFVKREDLCAIDKSAPPFSKIRGIVEHLKMLKKKGINIVGYTETSISMAGWGVAWACKMLDMTCVIFMPEYKEKHEVLEYHKKHWIELGALIIPLKAGMAKVNYYISKKHLFDLYGNKAVLLPLGLPFDATVQATSQELINTMSKLSKVNKIIVNVGSGTICAGLLKGLTQMKYDGGLWGVMGRTGNMQNKRESIEKKAGVITDYDHYFCSSEVKLILVDSLWEYTQKSEQSCPFPCHAYYDLKAWQFLVEKIGIFTSTKGNILFWNIGH